MTVAVNVTRTGTVGDIALTAPNLPANLSVAFSPETLPEGTNTAQLTITAVGGMAPSTGDVTVHASGGGGQHDATISVSTTTITVSGKVRSGTQNVKVGLIGKPIATTGAGGVFTFTDVTPPYDLYTVGDSGNLIGNTHIPTIYFYDDLTVTDPIVDQAVQSGAFLVFCLSPQICSSTVSGARSGSGNNTDPMLVAWSKGGGQLSTSGGWNFSASGFTSSTSTGALHALQYTRNANSQPTGYFYGSTNATISTTTITLNVSLATLATTSTVTGTLTQPAGFAAPSVTLTQRFGDTNVNFLPFDATTINLVAPQLNGNPTSLFATTSTGGATSARSQPINNAAVDVTFSMLVPPQQTAPVSSATGVTSTTPFTWTSDASTVHEVNMSNANVAFRVYTSKTSTTIPAVPEQALPAAQNMTWSVTDYPGTTVNTFVSMTPPRPAGIGQFDAPRAHAASTSRSFTSAN